MNQSSKIQRFLPFAQLRTKNALIQEYYRERLLTTRIKDKKKEKFFKKASLSRSRKRYRKSPYARTVLSGKDKPDQRQGLSLRQTQNPLFK